MKKQTEEELREFLASIGERIDACCDKHVADVLKEVVFEEAKERFDQISLKFLRIEIDRMINKKFFLE